MAAPDGNLSIKTIKSKDRKLPDIDVSTAVCSRWHCRLEYCNTDGKKIPSDDEVHATGKCLFLDVLGKDCGAPVSQAVNVTDPQVFCPLPNIAVRADFDIWRSPREDLDGSTFLENWPGMQPPRARVMGYDCTREERDVDCSKGLDQWSTCASPANLHCQASDLIMEVVDE